MLQHPSLPVQIFSQSLQIKSTETDGDGKAGGAGGGDVGVTAGEEFSPFPSVTTTNRGELFSGKLSKFPHMSVLLYFYAGRESFVCVPATHCMNATITAGPLATNKLKSLLSADCAFCCNSQLHSVSNSLLRTQTCPILLDDFACQPGRGFSSELESTSYSWILSTELRSLTGHTSLHAAQPVAHCSRNQCKEQA